MTTINKELIKRLRKSILNETDGYINSPVENVVVMTREGMLNYLKENYKEQVLHDRDYYKKHMEEKEEAIWEELDWGDLQDEIEKYSNMCTWCFEINGCYHYIGNIEDIKDKTLLKYAAWYNTIIASSLNED